MRLVALLSCSLVALASACETSTSPSNGNVSTTGVSASTAVGSGGSGGATNATGSGDSSASEGTGGSANDDEALALELGKATEGLHYTSESDYPYEVVLGSTAPGAPILEETLRSELAAYVDAKPDADKPLAGLFAMQRSWAEWKAQLLSCADPNDPYQVEQCAKRKALEALLEAKLTSLTVFYFGSVGAPGAVDGIGVTIVLVGRSPSGRLVGVATLAIWT
jgi:hypothetical protein